MTGPTQLPTPPEAISVHASVVRQWNDILDLWKRGWHAESSVERVESYLEFHRERIFDKGSVDGQFDWQGDWAKARTYSDNQRDLVANRRAHNDDLRRMWSEWHERQQGTMVQIGLEALRSMIIVNGAAILACLTLLSGQIEHPRPSALLAAKVMLLCAILSLTMNAAGHAYSYARTAEVTSRVRGALVGHLRHRRLYAIGRYMRWYLDPVIERSNALIYGSIFVFALSALISALIIIFDAAN